MRSYLQTSHGTKVGLDATFDICFAAAVVALHRRADFSIKNTNSFHPTCPQKVTFQFVCCPVNLKYALLSSPTTHESLLLVVINFSSQ